MSWSDCESDVNIVDRSAPALTAAVKAVVQFAWGTWKAVQSLKSPLATSAKPVGLLVVDILVLTVSPELPVAVSRFVELLTVILFWINELVWPST
jgi:hypothetical protein